MYAALWIPEFPLQALVRPHAACWRSPLAVLDDVLSAASASGGASRKKKAPMISLNEAARDHGVLRGMTATQGQARCAALRLFMRDREAEMIAQEALLEVVGNFSPDYEDTAPGCCVADLLGRGSLRGREEAVGMQMREALKNACGLEAQAGLAMTPDLAVLAAQMAGAGESKVKVLPDGGPALIDSLAREPLAYLDPPQALQEILQGWGIHHIGPFLDLPRGEVSRRLGKEAAFLWDKVSGTRRRLLRLVRMPVDYRQSYLFDYEVEQLEPVLFVIRRLLETLVARLDSVYLAADQIELAFVFADKREATQVLRVPDPTTDVDLLFRILHTRLENFVAESPIASVSLALQPARPSQRQLDLFGSVLRDPNRFGQTLARLEALLGQDRVGSPQPLDTHRPDAFVLRPFEEVLEKAMTHRRKRDGTKSARVRETASGTDDDEGSAKTYVISAVLLGLPLRRFRPPPAVRVETARTPEGHAVPASVEGGPCRTPAPVRQWQGPWKSSGDWWEQGRVWKREEWDVQLADGRLYRLVREATGWVLEGEYG